MGNFVPLTQWLLSAVSNVAEVISTNFGIIGIMVLGIPLLRKITSWIQRLFRR